MQHSQMTTNLEIDGIEEKISSIYSMRWVDVLDGNSFPVLYKNGKRVVKSWKLSISYNSPEDEFGSNANTN